MKYNVSLDSKELFKLSSDLLKYADDFENKVKIFLERLAQVGISVAVANSGVFSRYIVYSIKQENNTTVKLVASSEPIESAWYVSSKSEEQRTEVISPILMAEFGSGHYAIQGTGEATGLGGQGTLNVYGHAFDSDGWYWWSEEASQDGVLKKSKNGRFLYQSDGLPPAQPLHKAVMACIERVEEIAREVFG